MRYLYDTSTKKTYVPSSPATSMRPCSWLWLATSLSLWGCCWRTAPVWESSCSRMKLCVSSTGSYRTACFAKSSPSLTTASPWPTCLRRSRSCWAVSHSWSTPTPHKATSAACLWMTPPPQWVGLSLHHLCEHKNTVIALKRSEIRFLQMYLFTSAVGFKCFLSEY